MKITYPIKGKASDIICRTLFEHGPLTMDEGIAIHRLINRFRNATERSYEAALNKGYVYFNDGKYHLAPFLRLHYQRQADPANQPANIAQPRQISVFGPVLSAKYIPSVEGLREGSNDAKQWPSRFA